MINILDLVARIFISLVFLLSGINKIGNYEGTIGWMESLGMPGIFLIPAIMLEIVAPILIIIGYKVKISAALLSLFCIATAVIFHNDFSNQMQFISFMKNIALGGGFLFLVINGPKNYSLDKKFS
ncbi:DoxX family protein [Candidatus Pelagibacter sp.]|nr:DoxX family protein [Candidatus Pelagibacter sp.]